MAAPLLGFAARLAARKLKKKPSEKLRKKGPDSTAKALAKALGGVSAASLGALGIIGSAYNESQKNKNKRLNKEEKTKASIEKRKRIKSFMEEEMKKIRGK
jgi:hypothetical protein